MQPIERTTSVAEPEAQVWNDPSDVLHDRSRPDALRGDAVATTHETLTTEPAAGGGPAVTDSTEVEPEAPDRL